MTESIAEQLLRRKNELIEGWDQWTSGTPFDPGTQCAVLRRHNETFQWALSEEARAFSYLTLRRSLASINDNSGPDYRTVVLDALDRCIAEAKDRGI